jgi:hypothetical protein
MVLEGTSSRYNGKNHNTEELNKCKEEFVQRHTDDESLAYHGLKEFTSKAKNFNSLSKLFKYQVGKYNDLYLFPGLLASSRLAQSGFRICFHASG